MKLYQRVRLLQRELARAVRLAYRAHGSVRAGAVALGMPRSTFHDYLTRGAR